MATPPKSERKDKDRKVLCRNRKARYDYEIESTLEAGMVLVGSEVKSLRESHASLVDAHAQVRRGELWLVGAKIEPYKWANQFNHEPERDRKLLAHKQEIRKLATKVAEKGYSIIPLEIYLKDGKIKVELALAKGKRQFEKRATKRKQEAEREMDQG